MYNRNNIYSTVKTPYTMSDRGNSFSPWEIHGRRVTERKGFLKNKYTYLMISYKKD